MRVSHLSWAPCAVLRVCFIASFSNQVDCLTSMDDCDLLHWHACPPECSIASQVTGLWRLCRAELQEWRTGK